MKIYRGGGVYFDEAGGNSKQTIILFWPEIVHFTLALQCILGIKIVIIVCLYMFSLVYPPSNESWS